MHVVDTSVLLTWVVPEEGSRDTWLYAGTPLMAPDLLLVGFANALWKKVRRSEIGAKQARAALATVSAPFTLVPAAPFAADALEIGLELGHPVYDCVFVALARSAGLKLLTVDRRLAKACEDSRFEDVVKLI